MVRARTPRIALVHDWLTVSGGAELVLQELHTLFPDAPIYTSVANLEKVPAFKGADVRTTYLQTRLPKALRFLFR